MTCPGRCSMVPLILISRLNKPPSQAIAHPTRCKSYAAKTFSHHCLLLFIRAKRHVRATSVDGASGLAALCVHWAVLHSKSGGF